jgi:DNA-binding phage protein
MANKQFIVKHGIDVKRNDGTSSLAIDSGTGATTIGQALQTNSTITAGVKLTV